MTLSAACRLMILFVGLSSLTGCARTKEELGLTRRTPDEFAVITRAPLEMPPAGTPLLPPPQPGRPRPQEVSPLTTAETTVLGKPLSEADNQSQAESILLEKAGASGSTPNIRTIVDKEAVEDTKDNRPVIQRLMNIGSESAAPPATVVDAPGELRRLKENRATGKPVTHGETPSQND